MFHDTKEKLISACDHGYVKLFPRWMKYSYPKYWSYCLIFFFLFLMNQSPLLSPFHGSIDRTEVSDKSRWTIKNGESNGKIWDQAPRHFASDLRLDHSTQDPRYERRSRNSSRNPCEIPHQFDHGYHHVAPSLVTSGPGLVARVPPPSFTGAKSTSSATSSYIKHREYWIQLQWKMFRIDSLSSST